MDPSFSNQNSVTEFREAHVPVLGCSYQRKTPFPSDIAAFTILEKLSLLSRLTTPGLMSNYKLSKSEIIIHGNLMLLRWSWILIPSEIMKRTTWDPSQHIGPDQ
jgi:hypothetical protein